ncbi:ArgS-related anticodon-binding protein NrtL [Streptomyces sp. NPDC018019]|uniref:ArgS-related anticodon-binding protein NrtL n=1 Tax=Streptomyces sp. NPDC018019 TaxID=3365030 RepID=UPI0037AFAF68
MKPGGGGGLPLPYAGGVTPAEFSRAVLCSVRGAVEDGELSVTVPERVVVRVPGSKGSKARQGGGDGVDFACDVALQVAKEAGRPPREVAEVLRKRLTGVPGVAGVGVAGAGFLNVTLTGAARAGLVRSVLAQGRAYGNAGGRGRVELRAAEGAGVRAAVTVEALERILPAGGVGTSPGGEEVRPREVRPGELRPREILPREVRSRDVRPQEDRPREARSPEDRPREVRVRPQGVEVPSRAHPESRLEPRPEPRRESDRESRLEPRPELHPDLHPEPHPNPQPAPSDALSQSAVASEWRLLTTRLGPDEVRWALLRPAQGDAVRLPDRPVQQEGNARFRVQYAYARTCAMTRNARDLGFAADPGALAEMAETTEMAGTAETAGTVEAGEPSDRAGSAALRDLFAAIAEYPAVVEAAARHRAPDRVARHLEVTADAWLRCHDVCPPLPVGEEKPSAVHRGRLALAEAAGTVLANGLHLLGISTPDRL